MRLVYLLYSSFVYDHLESIYLWVFIFILLGNSGKVALLVVMMESIAFYFILRIYMITFSLKVLYFGMQGVYCLLIIFCNFKELGPSLMAVQHRMLANSLHLLVELPSTISKYYLIELLARSCSHLILVLQLRSWAITEHYYLHSYVELLFINSKIYCSDQKIANSQHL